MNTATQQAIDFLESNGYIVTRKTPAKPIKSVATMTTEEMKAEIEKVRAKRRKDAKRFREQHPEKIKEYNKRYNEKKKAQFAAIKAELANRQESESR